MNMTEQRIFQIILKDYKIEEKSFDFPTLEEESVNIITKNFTDIIYETLKQKSSYSGIKRGNILKFINNLCATKPFHLREDNCKYDLEVIKNSFKSPEQEDVDAFVRNIKYELEKHVSNNLTQDIVNFYEKKNSIQKEKNKRLEYIKKMDQEKLDTKFNIQVTKNFSYYETNKQLISSLLGDTSCSDSNDKVSSLRSDYDFREKQIKLGYAIINLKYSEEFLVEKILHRLSKYSVLSDIEQNFVQYLWELEGEMFNLEYIIAEKFLFVLERLILRCCTEVLSLDNSDNLCQYFVDLENNKQFMKMRKLCRDNSLIYYKLKSIIFNLYCFSFCNENVLKFCDFIL